MAHVSEHIERSQRTAAKSSGVRQAPFHLVAPVVASALVVGAAGGFALAATLTITSALGASGTAEWLALVQAHGHLQLYGWAGLFVLGVASHFLPRLRGRPLAGQRFVLPLLLAQLTALTLRAFGQPLATASDAGIWRVLFAASGIVELAALGGLATIIAVTFARGPALRTRPAFLAVLPLLALAFLSLTLAALLNLANVIAASRTPAVLVAPPGDSTNVTLGLFGFLLPMALAMSAQSLPMYAGLAPFPRMLLWPLAGVYALGLALLCGTSLMGWPILLAGFGMLLVGGALLFFVAIFIKMMRQRGRLPHKVADLAPSAETAARNYRSHVITQRATYGPFVALVASAYIWACVGGILFVIDGMATLFGAGLPLSYDAARHSFAAGFIALLICGIAPRMLPGFSGGHIRSPRLVTATLWLGNCAALLRVGSALAAPYATSGFAHALTEAAFALSGPLGLALALVLLLNLWPAIFPAAHDK
ncbi:MAG: hypothetical protein OJF49_004628 [Ktedonobacterales bacterium]|nr:MAG: hypothetical protein OJF49_004628 [Ktedonobacterales bacterium]